MWGQTRASQEQWVTILRRVGNDNMVRRPSRTPQVQLTTRAPSKRMTNAEFADTKAKGLCFCCGGKFASGHRCPDKTLLLVDVEEEEPERQEHVHLDMVSMSASSIMGFTTPHTMKPCGMISDQEEVVLIDNGATHNFFVITHCRVM